MLYNYYVSMPHETPHANSVNLTYSSIDARTAHEYCEIQGVVPQSDGRESAEPAALFRLVSSGTRGDPSLSERERRDYDAET